MKIPTCAAAVLCALLALPATAQESLGSTSQPLKVKPDRPADACKQGFVWREARRGDKVCVTPGTRTLVARQNRDAPRHWVQGNYGKHTCTQGLVWREAFQGDTVCVPPAFRDQTHQDNARAPQRRERS